MRRKPIHYFQRDWHIVSYKPFYLKGTEYLFRGPEPDLNKPYFSCVGAAQTFGCLCEDPYPNLLSEDIELPVLNLGFGGAGALFFENKELLNTINKGKFAVIQIMSGRNESNSLLNSRNGVVPLYRTADKKKLTPPDAYKWLLENHDLATVKKVVEETRESWVQSYKSLLSHITVPTILFWFSKRSPDYTETYDTSADLLGNFPHLVNRAMIQKVSPKANFFVECTMEEYSFRYINRFTGNPTSIVLEYFDGKRKTRSHEFYYPSPRMHKEASKMLLEPSKKALDMHQAATPA